MKNNTLSPHLKSTFSFVVVELPSRHKTDTGVGEEENYSSCYVRRVWDHLTSVLSGNLADKQIDTCRALAQYLYWSGDAAIVPAAEMGPWRNVGLTLCCCWHTSMSISSRVNSPKSPSVLWVAQVTCHFYCNIKTTTWRWSPPKHSTCYNRGKKC